MSSDAFILALAAPRFKRFRLFSAKKLRRRKIDDAKTFFYSAYVAARLRDSLRLTFPRLLEPTMRHNANSFNNAVYNVFVRARRFRLSSRSLGVAPLFLAAFFSLATSRDVALEAAETTRFGAVLIPSAPVEPSDAKSRKFERPQIVFSEKDNAADWRVVEGEAHVGVDATRFYFTVEAPGANVQAPRVEVVWPGVEVARVLGARDGKFEKTERGVSFELASRTAPTCVFTEVPFGAVRLGVFHNREERRAGPYREGVYPEPQIKAQLNFMIGALEVCRELGWTETTTPGFVDHINLYGFETCYPNGHRDFPPHFHIMLGWDGWAGAHVAHYLLDAKGLILKNNQWSLHEDVETFYGRGETTPFPDKTGRVIFETTILPDGTGLVIRPIYNAETDKSQGVASRREFLIRAGRETAVESVEVCARPLSSAADAPWSLLCEATANDDSVAGKFRASIRYVDGGAREIAFDYDPDRGGQLKR